MKNLKYAIAGLATVGIIAAFLPWISLGEQSISLWDIRKMDAGQFWLTMISLIVPLVMGGLALARGAMARWQAIVATLGFALATLKVRDGFEAAIGGKLMLIAAGLGIVVALVASIKPEPRHRMA